MLGPTLGPTNGTLERELIRLITTTIKPDSWSGLGGEGTIEYFPIGLALVINQSPEVIEEVERLLESLRKLQDLEVSIEVKVVSPGRDVLRTNRRRLLDGDSDECQAERRAGRRSIGINKNNFSGNVVGLQIPHIATPDLDIPIRATSFNRAVPPFGGFTNSFNEGGISLGMAFLSDIQVQMFLEAAQGDTRTNVMQAPKLTALNGTAASMTVGDFQFFVTGITVSAVNGQLVFTPQNVPFAVGITQPIPPNASIQNGLIELHANGPADARPRVVHPAGGVGRSAVRAIEHSAVVHELDQRNAADSDHDDHHAGVRERRPGPAGPVHAVPAAAAVLQPGDPDRGGGAGRRHGGDGRARST